MNEAIITANIFFCNKKAAQRIKRLAYCDISPMTQIIKEYKSMSDFYLMQLVKEMEIYRVSEDERSELLDFLDYLRSVTSEIEDILLVEH